MNDPYRRASTDWFHEAGWGVMHHLCFHAPTEMSAAEWNRLVDNFDVNGLAAQLAEVGAGYLLFTIGQGSGHYCAPNDTYDRIAGVKPSKCSRRNLIVDLADALSERGIAMMAYVAAEGSWADLEARKGLGLTKHWSDGEQYHLLNFLGSEWGKGEPRFPDQLVAGYTRYAIDQGAVMTWDVPVNPAGRIEEPFLAQLRGIGEAVPRHSTNRHA
jgi:hypothetical protein